MKHELDLANKRLKDADSEKRDLEHRLEHAAIDVHQSQESRVKTLQSQVTNLKRENARLAESVSGPSTSSIPVPKQRQPRSSSVNGIRPSQLEGELRECQASLAKAEAQCKQAEERRRKAQDQADLMINEKIALERRTKSAKEELESKLQDALDELEGLRSGGWNNHEGTQSGNTADYERTVKENASLKEQLTSLRQDKDTLQRNLKRKTDQLSNLQDRLDELEYQNDDDLRKELVAAQADAKQARFELETYQMKSKVCRLCPMFRP